MQWYGRGGQGTDVRTLSPRITPTPTPLAIPFKRLFRAHGISPMRCTSSYGDNLYYTIISGKGQHESYE
jgi:hypothetical protein